MSLLNILPNTSRYCSLLSLFISTSTLLHFSTTLWYMYLLSTGFTWIPYVYMPFSCGAPQLRQLEWFCINHQSNCMVDSKWTDCMWFSTREIGVLVASLHQSIINNNKIMIICSFCNVRYINPLGSQGAAVWLPQHTYRLLNLRQSSRLLYTQQETRNIKDSDF